VSLSGVGNCEGWRELISRAADGTLGPSDEARLQAHVSECPACAAESRADGELRLLLRRDPLPLTEISLPSGQDIARTIREAEAPAHRRPVRPVWGWAGALTATAAAVLLIVGRGPAPNAPSPLQSPPAVTQPASGFWIVDDERTGRDVIVGPAVSLSGAP